MEYKDRSPEVKKVIHDLAIEFGFGNYSTVDEIDYKFWEDIESKHIAIALAEKIVELQNEIPK